MRSMPWNEDLWRKLKDAVSAMPSFVRQRALRTIVEASEALAQERGSEVVEEEDLVKAAKTKTPALTRQLMLDALVEVGINVDAADGAKPNNSHR
jgi:DNA replicative helicase MCM subunit Mcm2 (Cdc46/Mcm family)